MKKVLKKIFTFLGLCFMTGMTMQMKAQANTYIDEIDGIPYLIYETQDTAMTSNT